MIWAFIGASVLSGIVGFIAGVYSFQQMQGKTSPFAKLPCPSCGNRKSDLAYDAEAKKLKRRCLACSCVVIQDTYAPQFFKKD